MKLLLALLLTAASTANAQSPVKMKTLQPVYSTAVRVIPAPKAVLIRKDVATLKVQSLQLKDSVTVLKTEIDQLVETINARKDSMSEMGETESIRLQMAMDRLTKMMNTLSNLLKKISDTGSQITRNMK